MFRIRKILDNTTLANQLTIEEVVSILKAQFPTARVNDILKLRDQLNDPFRYRYRSILIISEDGSGRLKGFAMLLHFTDLKIGYLELISTAPGETGGGVGSALYEKVREECRDLKMQGLFYECEIDDKELIKDSEILKLNEKRLRFYEKYGVCPVLNNLYASPVLPGDQDLYYLMFDNLGYLSPPSRKQGQKYVHAILERKYGDLMPVEQIDEVVKSFRDDPWLLRAPRFYKPSIRSTLNYPLQSPKIGLVVNLKHEIDHTRELGYAESPVKIDSILAELMKTDLFQRLEPRTASEKWILAVHDRAYIRHLKSTCKQLESDRSIYPQVFPFSRRDLPYNKHQTQVGYFATDTFTPLSKNVVLAAKSAVNCALTAADYLLSGKYFAYALIRPPGHHAGKRFYGAFCYYNSTAVAANYLSRFGRIAILDIDYHHGNGTQDIFYDRADVLTISIHADPKDAYPYTSGSPRETGTDEGKGFNINLPLPLEMANSRFMSSLEKALKKIRQFNPSYLLIAFGFDTAASDPTGSWGLKPTDFHKSGAMIGKSKLPTLIVQEGGYRTPSHGILARSFFEGLLDGYHS
jgi:acetoin utilization deacetylase AcuC-like enzyme/GNAT superfamily N-acetyltransferase